MIDKVHNALDFQQLALGLRAHRQQVLAGNIANSDTPNYKARDFDFSTALKEAVAGRAGGNLVLEKTAQGHMAGSLSASPARLLYSTPAQSSVDGNTVDMDVERAKFSENAMQYQAGLAFISHEIKMRVTAAQG